MKKLILSLGVVLALASCGSPSTPATTGTDSTAVDTTKVDSASGNITVDSTVVPKDVPAQDTASQ